MAERGTVLLVSVCQAFFIHAFVLSQRLRGSTKTTATPCTTSPCQRRRKTLGRRLARGPWTWRRGRWPTGARTTMTRTAATIWWEPRLSEPDRGRRAVHPGRSQVGRRSSESSFSRIIHEQKSEAAGPPAWQRLPVEPSSGRGGGLHTHSHTHTHFHGIIKAEGSRHVGEDRRGRATVREQQSLFLTLYIILD